MPRLAEHLGTTVEAIKAETAQRNTVQAMTQRSKELTRERIGPQAKMNAVIADGSLLAIMMCGAFYKAASEESRAIITPVLESQLGEGAGDMILQFVDDVAAGDLVTPIQAKGLDVVLGDVRACAGAAVTVIKDMAQAMAQAQAQSEPKASEG